VKVGDLVKFQYNKQTKAGVILSIEPNSYDPKLWETASILVGDEVWRRSPPHLEVISEGR